MKIEERCTEHTHVSREAHDHVLYVMYYEYVSPHTLDYCVVEQPLWVLQLFQTYIQESPEI